MAINYASQYQEALDQPFKAELKFEALYDYNLTSTNRFRFVRGKTVEISTLTVGGMKDTDRDNITWASRNHDNSWEAYTLDHDREFSSAIDPADIDETNMVVAVANISSVFVTEELIPEMDKYMASKLYSEVEDGGNTIDTTTIDSGATALSVFDDLSVEADEAEIPDEGRICYVTPPIYRYFKEALENARRVGTSQSTTELNRAITRLEETQLVKVPSSRMKSAYDFTEGADPATDAVQINMILAHPRAVIAPFKIDQALVDEPTAASKGKYPYYQRQYWDVFVLAKKLDGIQINAEAAA